MSSRMQVFLSHSSADKPVARRIKERLSAFNINVWLDEAEIRVGDSIPEKVAEGMSSSAALCLLVSKHSSISKWVKRELNAFLHRMMDDNVVILPCRIDDSQMPALIRDIKYADFSHDFEYGITEICNAIRIRDEIKFQVKKHKFKEMILEVITTLAVDNPKMELQSLIKSLNSHRRYYYIDGTTKVLVDAFLQKNAVSIGYNYGIYFSLEFKAAVNALLNEIT